MAEPSMAQAAGCQDDGEEPEKLARFLIEKKGFAAEDMELRLSIRTFFSEEVISKISLVVSLAGKRTLMLRYAPGSVTTRERSAVAAARLLDKEQQIPLVVVTNGVEAVMLDTHKGRKLAESLDELPSKEQLSQQLTELCFDPFTDEKKREREKRVLNAFDVDL